MTRQIIASDIGGSHITAALVDYSQKESFLSSVLRKDLHSSMSKNELLNAWSACFEKLLSQTSEHFTSQISIALPGPFDYLNGIGLYNPNGKFGQLGFVNLKNELATRLGNKIDFHFLNDAASFGLGEALYGDISKYSKTIAITLGTGIGSVFMQNGNVVSEGEGVPHKGELYQVQYGDGIADDYFSTRWFINASLKNGGPKVSGVKELVEKGDRMIVASIFEEFCENLVSFLLSICKDYKAQAVVFGGNITKAKMFFWEEIQSRFRFENIKIYLSENTERSICLGAAISASNRFVYE